MTFHPTAKTTPQSYYSDPLTSHEKVFIILPAYNAAQTLERTVAEIPLEYRQNLILTDDCSTDNTVEVAHSLGLQVIVHERNKGYGGNQKTCYQAALNQGATIMVMLHPDHQYDASIIPQLVQPIMERKADAVFGSRMLGHRPLQGGMPRWKYNANVLLTACANLVFGRYLTETHSGFRAYSRKYLETVQFELNSDDFVFDMQIIAQGMVNSLLFYEVPIITRYFPEASSINFTRSTVYGLGILQVLLQYILHTRGIVKIDYLQPKAAT